MSAARTPGAGVPPEMIDAARAIDILVTARRYTALKRGGAAVWAGPCPVGGGFDRFSVNTRKQLWNCHGGSKGGDVIDLVVHARRVSFRAAVAELTGNAATANRNAASLVAHKRATQARSNGDADARRNRDLALRIWREAGDPCGTPVETYLASRGLTLPVEAASEALRLASRCPFGRGHTTPATVALVRDIRSDEPIGIRRTALDLSDTKRAIDGKDRMMLGPAAGGVVVKLTPDVGHCLAIGEGIETTLSIPLMPDWPDGPVWACLSAGNLATFPLIAGIETLAIAVDHDQAGEKAAAETVVRWLEAGRTTLVLRPAQPGTNLNDLIGPSHDVTDG